MSERHARHGSVVAFMGIRLGWICTLDAQLALDEPSSGELERAMASHILAQTDLVGTYQKTQ